MYIPGDIREPYCIHSDNTQPASWCLDCKDGPDLAAYYAYWQSRPYELVFEDRGGMFDVGRFVERPDSGLSWSPGQMVQQVDGRPVCRLQKP